MDPIDLHSNELESFLGEYGSRSKLKRDSIKSNKSMIQNRIIGKGNSSLAIGTPSQNTNTNTSSNNNNNNSLPRVNKRTRTVSENINNNNNNNNSSNSKNNNNNANNPRFWKSQELRKFSASSIIPVGEKDELSSSVSIMVNVDDLDTDSKGKERYSSDSTKLLEEDEYLEKSGSQEDTENEYYDDDDDGKGEGDEEEEEDRKVDDEERGMHQKNEEDDDDEAEARKEMGKRRHRFTGLGLAFLSCLAFSLSSLIVKYLKEYHPFTMSAWRFQGLVIPAIPMMIYVRCVRKENIFNTIWPPTNKTNLTNIFYLMLRSTVGLATIILQFYALRYIPLADQMVIASSQPVLVSIVAFFLLGEPCGFVPFLTGILTILGVGIVAKPPFLTGSESFDAETLKGSMLAMGSTMMSVLSIICMRRMATSHVHFTLITFTFGLWSTIFSSGAAVSLNVFQLPREEHVLIVIGLIVLVFVSQTSTTLALQYEQAGPVSLTRGSTIVFAFVWQYVFLGVVPDLLSMVGAAIILVGVVTTAVRKWVSTLPLDHAARKKIGFILK